MEKLNLKRYQEGEDMEQQVLNSLMQERIDNLNREFQKHLNTLEKKVFRGMLDELTVSDVINLVGETTKGAFLTYEQVRHIKNKIELRALCWYASNDLFSTDVTLRLFNKHPNLCSRYFGKEKITEIPDRKRLREVVKENKERLPQFFHDEPKHGLEEICRRATELFGEIKISRGSSDHFVCSSRFYRGKSYDHPVVYINGSGHAYSHVDKSTWDIFDGFPMRHFDPADWRTDPRQLYKLAE